MKLLQFGRLGIGISFLAMLVVISGCTSLEAPLGDSGMGSQWSSDQDLAAAVRDRLAADDVVGDLPIGVTVRNGVIVLRGLVPDEVTRARVIGIALSTPGVVQVEDELSLW